jgi:hypothetical protein
VMDFRISKLACPYRPKPAVDGRRLACGNFCFVVLFHIVLSKTIKLTGVPWVQKPLTCSRQMTEHAGARQ